MQHVAQGAASVLASLLLTLQSARPAHAVNAEQLFFLEVRHDVTKAIWCYSVAAAYFYDKICGQ